MNCLRFCLFLVLFELYFPPNTYAQASKEGDSLKTILSRHEQSKDTLSAIKDCFRLSRWASKEGRAAASLDYLFKALKLAENKKDKKQQAECSYRLAVLYDRQNDTRKAISYASQTITLAKQAGDSTLMAAGWHRMGLSYCGEKNYPMAESSLKSALEIRTRLKQKGGIAACLNGLGVAYMDQKKYPEATAHVFRAYSLWKEVHDREGIAIASGNLGTLCLDAGDYEGAIRYAKQSYDTARAIGSFIFMEPAARTVSDAYLKLGDFKNAYVYYRTYAQVKDTLFNEENTQRFAQAQADYQTQKVEKQLLILESDKKQGALIRNLLITGMCFVLLLVIAIYNRYQLKRKANLRLQDANIEIQRSRDEVSSQKKELTDSINYARRIQQAILPGNQELLKTLPDSFIHYQPKDIVSGDFYWYTHTENKSIVAAVDCTGHGVPGAFMSMIGNDLINDIVNEKKIQAPADILNELDKRLRISLTKSGSNEEIHDGMDLALCSIDRQSQVVTFSGAHRPLIHVRKGIVKEYKADKYAIGGYEIPGKRFSEIQIPVEAGDAIYLFTDGFTDQFGGPQGKKFKYKRFIAMLGRIAAKTMREQEKEIAETFRSWKGDLEQLDDILVMGIRL